MNCTRCGMRVWPWERTKEPFTPWSLGFYTPPNGWSYVDQGGDTLCPMAGIVDSVFYYKVQKHTVDRADHIALIGDELRNVLNELSTTSD